MPPHVMYNVSVMEKNNIKKSFIENLSGPVGILVSVTALLALSALALAALRKDASVDLFECLYTAVSAFTLCGSSIVSLSGFHPAGIFFIALLSEAGAVFVMYVSCRIVFLGGHAAELVLGKKRWLFSLSAPGSLRGLLVFIVVYLLVLEAAGAAMFTGVFSAAYPLSQALLLGTFTSVSAVTGNGMSLLEGRALSVFSVNYMYDIVCSVLLILSALGPLFACAALSAGKKGEFSRTMLMQSVVFVIITLMLCTAVCVFEWDGSLPPQTSVSSAILRVVGARSASLMGEETAASLSFASKAALFAAMFTGGLSGSSTGGLKMGAVILICLFLFLAPSQGENIRTKKVRFTRTAFLKPVYLALSGIGIIFIMALVMSATCRLDYSHVLFETVSAFTLSGIHAVKVSVMPCAFNAVYMITMLIGRFLPMYLARSLDRSVTREEPSAELMVLGRSDMVV